MVKKIVIGALSLIVVGAVGIGVYDYVRAAPVDAQSTTAGTLGTQAQVGVGQGNAHGGGQAAGAVVGQQGAGTGDPQSVPSSEWTTRVGVVQAVEVNGLSLLTADGQPLWIQLGPNHFWSGQIAFAVGDALTVTGFDENGQFMAAAIVNDTGGQAFTLRNEAGQPLWAGGNGGSGGNGGDGGKGNGNGNR